MCNNLVKNVYKREHHLQTSGKKTFALSGWFSSHVMNMAENNIIKSRCLQKVLAADAPIFQMGRFFYDYF